MSNREPTDGASSAGGRKARFYTPQHSVQVSSPRVHSGLCGTVRRIQDAAWLVPYRSVLLDLRRPRPKHLFSVEIERSAIVHQLQDDQGESKDFHLDSTVLPPNLSFFPVNILRFQSGGGRNLEID